MKTYSLILTLSFFFLANLTAQDLAVLTDNNKIIKKTTKTAFIPNVEVQASFDGGFEELTQFLETNLVYPAIGRKNNIEGTVLVEFTVTVDGSIQNAKVIKGLGLGFDKEVLRLVNTMPNWTPAKQGVHTVISKVRIPIAFLL